MPDLRRYLERARSVRRPEPAAALPPGLHAYEREFEGRRVRFHLRVEPDGRGVLLADASAAVRLSEAGALIARRLLEERHPADVRAEVLEVFRGVSAGTVDRDVAEVGRLLASLGTSGRDYPVANLDDAAVTPGDVRLLAPLEATVPVGDPERMRAVLERLWAAGVPHVVFRCDAARPAGDRVRAVERAEDLGMIAGVAGRALDLGDDAGLAELAEAGVDHVTLGYAAAGPDAHDALYGAGDHARAEAAFAALAALELCAVAEVPLTPTTVAGLEPTLLRLAEHGVSAATLFAIAAPDGAAPGDALPARALPQVATLVEELASDLDVRLLWQPPVRFDPSLDVAAQVRRGPRCSGDVAMRVEADGTVYAARGPRTPAGNLLSDPWESVWGHEVFRVYRERVERPTRCGVCPGLAICAADCPAEPRGWAE